MLTAIKERASGWIAYTLVGFISIPFVLWGINSYFEGASKITVATVNGVEVDETIYQQALSEQRRSLVQMMGRNVDAEIFASEPFKLQVLESLIDTQLQAEYLADRGYRITNEQLSSRIAAFAAFQSEGRFDSARYEMLLQNAGLTVEGFERQQRQQGAPFETFAEHGRARERARADAREHGEVQPPRGRKKRRRRRGPHVVHGDAAEDDADAAVERAANSAAFSTQQRAALEFIWKCGIAELPPLCRVVQQDELDGCAVLGER